MLIECKLKREGGSRITIGDRLYHFAPRLSGGPHVADVDDRADIGRFLGIAEAYQIPDGPPATAGQPRPVPSLSSPSPSPPAPAAPFSPVPPPAPAPAPTAPPPKWPDNPKLDVTELRKQMAEEQKEKIEKEARAKAEIFEDEPPEGIVEGDVRQVLQKQTLTNLIATYGPKSSYKLKISTSTLKAAMVDIIYEALTNNGSS